LGRGVVGRFRPIFAATALHKGTTARQVWKQLEVAVVWAGRVAGGGNGTGGPLFRLSPVSDAGRGAAAEAERSSIKVPVGRAQT